MSLDQTPDRTDDLPLLGQLPGFADLPGAALAELEGSGRVVTIPDGWSPIHQSEPADKVYVLLRGHLSVVRDGEEVARLGPGSPVGEMGLVDHRLRNAQVTSLDAVTVLVWSKDEFQALRRAHPELDDLVRRSTQERHDGR